MNAEVIITIFGIIVAYYSFSRAIAHKSKKGFKYDGYASLEINGALGVITAFEKYTDFDGRSSRVEFWYFILGSTLLSLLAMLIDANFLGGGQIASWILTFLFAIPQIAVATRRLHDTGRSGWLQLIGLTGIGLIPLIIWWASKPISGSYSKKIKTEKTSSKSKLAEELKELKELYKDGTLSKEEFTKAKNKLLK